MLAVSGEGEAAAGLMLTPNKGRTGDQRGHRAVHFAKGWGRNTSVQIWTKVWATRPKAAVGTELMSISSVCGSVTGGPNATYPISDPPSYRPPSYGRGGESGFGTRTSSPGSTTLF